MSTAKYSEPKTKVSPTTAHRNQLNAPILTKLTDLTFRTHKLTGTLRIPAYLPRFSRIDPRIRSSAGLRKETESVISDREYYRLKLTKEENNRSEMTIGEENQ